MIFSLAGRVERYFTRRVLLPHRFYEFFVGKIYGGG